MKKYSILKTISLDFIIDRDQQGYYLDPKPDCFLESDGITIWFNTPKGRHESITTANAIDLFLEQGRIEEVAENECSLCHNLKEMKDLQINDAGQFLCEKCRE